MSTYTELQLTKIDNFTNRETGEYNGNLQFNIALECLQREHFGQVHRRTIELIPSTKITLTTSIFDDLFNALIKETEVLFTKVNKHDSLYYYLYGPAVSFCIAGRVFQGRNFSDTHVVLFEVDIWYIQDSDCLWILNYFTENGFVLRHIKLLEESIAEGKVPVKFLLPSSDEESTTLAGEFSLVPFSSIRCNYNNEVALKIEQTITDMQTATHGMVIINGPAGCGKTYAIRSILSEVQRYSIICSPATMFLQRIDLLATAIMSQDKSIVILEDVGDILEVDDTTHYLNETANLLNLTEGLFSILSNTIFVVTFNYDIGKINSAFLRPGRCISHIEIGKLSHEQSQSLVDFPIERGLYSLAEIYEMRRQGKAISSTFDMNFFKRK